MANLSNINNKFLVTTGGNVGINSTGPGQKLAVEGSAAADENIIRINNQVDKSARIWIRNSAQSAYIFNSGTTPDTTATGVLAQAFGLGINNNSPIQFFNGLTASVKMTIDSSGNVGIGTTSPTEKLQIVQGEQMMVGDYLMIGSGDSSYLGVMGFNRDVTNGNIYNSSYGAYQIHNYQGTLKLQVYTAVGGTVGEHQFFNDGEVSFFGNVGIGTTTPTQAKLCIDGTQNSIYLTRGGASDTEWTISSDAVSMYISEAVGGYIMTLKENGYVGIGTTGPSYKLDVSGSSAVSMIRTPDTTAPTLGLFVNDGSNGVGTISVDNGGHMTFDTGSTGAGQAEKMRITAAGNVGIGYAYPDGYGTLTVNGTSALPILALRSSSGKVRQGFFEGGTGRFFLDTLNGSSGLSFVDGSTNTEKMRITSTGDVLINATSKFNGYPTTFKTQTLASDTGDYCPILELVGNRSAAVGNQNAMIQFYNKTSTAAEVGRISSIQSSATNSGELTFMTANAGTLAEKMRIASDGAVLVYPSTGSYGLSQNDVNQVMNSGYVAGSGTFVLTYTCASMSSMFIECVFNHYGYVTSYGCARVATFANGPSITIQDISVTTTGNGGSWSMARVSDTSFTVTKDAGTYAGAGYWYVKINGARVYSA